MDHQGYQVSEGQIKRGLSAEDQRLSSDPPDNGIINTVLLRDLKTLFHDEPVA